MPEWKWGGAIALPRCNDCGTRYMSRRMAALCPCKLNTENDDAKEADDDES
jgi:hypothetical protein